jgi:hypothetical protein
VLGARDEQELVGCFTAPRHHDAGQQARAAVVALLVAPDAGLQQAATEPLLGVQQLLVHASGAALVGRRQHGLHHCAGWAGVRAALAAHDDEALGHCEEDGNSAASHFGAWENEN